MRYTKILEDVAGNRVGRNAAVAQFDNPIGCCGGGYIDAVESVPAGANNVEQWLGSAVERMRRRSVAKIQLMVEGEV